MSCKGYAAFSGTSLAALAAVNHIRRRATPDTGDPRRLAFGPGAVWVLRSASRVSLLGMPTIRAQVHNGRLQFDAPTTLPEGTVIDLVADDEGDDLDPVERAALNEVVAQAHASISAGKGRPARDVLAELGRK